MKNKILKFIELIRESHEDDESELNDILLDLRDELINFEIHKGYFSKQAIDRAQPGDKVFSIIHNKPIYNEDKYCFCIEVPIQQLEGNLELPTGFGKRSLISDKKIFTIFRELGQISQRYDNCFLHINTGSVSYRPAIYLFILLDTEVDQSVTKITQVFKEIKRRNYASKSDFANDTTIRLEDDKIVIKSNGWSYTDRKFRNLISGIDLSDFKIEKTEIPGSVTNTIINTISKK